MNRLADALKHHETKLIAASLLIPVHQCEHIIPCAIVPGRRQPQRSQQRTMIVHEDHAGELRAFDGSTFLDSGLKDVVAELIEHTVSVKAYHVSADLKEAGLREFQNYGHTLGHAIEKLEHFRWRHGNAVAVGCVYAAELSHLLGYIDQDLVDYHRSLLGSLGLPTSWNNGTWDDVLALMHRDKKARGNKLRFVVLDRIGHPIHLEDPPADAVEEAFRRIQQ